ncbi:MAG: hypothetical protein R2744_07480 [Bacteroidales bacterium]
MDKKGGYTLFPIQRMEVIEVGPSSFMDKIALKKNKIANWE